MVVTSSAIFWVCASLKALAVMVLTNTGRNQDLIEGIADPIDLILAPFDVKLSQNLFSAIKHKEGWQ